MDQIISDELREHILSLEKELTRLNSWMFKTTEDYFGKHYVVNSKSRTLYQEMRPVLNEIYESLLCLAILVDKLGKEGDLN